MNHIKLITVNTTEYTQKFVVAMGYCKDEKRPILKYLNEGKLFTDESIKLIPGQEEVS